MAGFDLIPTTVSISSKDDGGEDRARTVGRGRGLTGVVVCDGVGGIAGSGVVAEEARDRAATLLGGRKLPAAIWNLDRRLSEDMPSQGQGKTTMVVICAEANGLVGHFLLGNGSILEVLPMEIQAGKPRLLWSSVVLPQIGGREGRPALRSFLPPDDRRAEAEKGVRMATAGIPRLYLACSDGFLSEEDRLEGAAPDGTFWRQVPQFPARLTQLLTDAWGDLLAVAPADAGAMLRELTERSIEDRAGGHPLDDDTTVGALLLRPRPDQGEKSGAGR